MMKKPGAKTLLLVFGIATFLILLTTTQRTLISIASTMPVAQSRLHLFFADATHWYLWAIALFPIYWFTDRLGHRITNRTMWFLVHLILAIAFGFSHILLQSVAISLSFQEPFAQIIKTNFFIKMALRISIYSLIAVACWLLISYQRRKQEEARVRDLENRVAVAQLQVLKSKLNPEFLFHTFRSISDLMRKDIEAADRLTARLGDFLRLSLETSGSRVVALQEEIDLVKSFIEIRRFDYPELKMVTGIDPHVIGTLVPNRVLLDLIQSAPTTHPIHFSAISEDGSLTLIVSGLNSRPESIVDSDSQSVWRFTGQQARLKLPLHQELETEFADEHFSQSLDEFQHSIADKESRIKNARPSRMRRFWGTLLVWTLVGLMFGSTQILASIWAGETFNLMEALQTTLIWYWWAVFTPFIFYLSRKFPLRPESMRKAVPIHFAFSLAIGFVMAFLYYLQLKIFPPEDWEVNLLMIVISYPFALDALMYWGIVGTHEMLSQRWQYLQEEVRSAKLKRTLMEAQLQTLKMQLHPHFLFNTLNSIAELMHEDLNAAEEMLKRLENFLRLTFENSEAQEITLQHELNYLRNYLDIQHVRFQNRLHVAIKIDPTAMHDRVPNLILQPIVENAIQHGVSPRVDSGKVEIRAFHHNGNLLLEVEDDGPGLQRESFREGVGMSNTRMRLHQIYGKECSFRVHNNPRGGLVVTLQIPATEIRHERTN